MIDHRARPTAIVSDIQVDDAGSTALPSSDLEKLRPEIAAVIATRGQCPPSVSYYLQDNWDTTYAIPTASILQACYAPSALASHLADPRKAPSFASDTNVFDGYSYGQPGLCYPMRSLRFIDRAEHEVSQILPRAATYYRIHRTFSPLLLRPPFTGKVTVAGSAVTKELDGRRVVVFTSSVCFYSKSAEALRHARYSRHKPHFARQLYRVTALADAGRGASYHGLQYSYDEFCDTHLFGRISRAVLESMRRGELREGPDVTYDVDELMRYQNWVAERLLR